jgi:uncharacterized damage-inducible protein DinB
MITQSIRQEIAVEANSTRKLFDAIPDDILGYQPTEFNWSIAKMAAHCATLYNWGTMILLHDVLNMDTYRYDKGDITSMAGINEKFEENLAELLETLDSYPEDNWQVSWSMTRGGKTLMPSMPRVQVFRSFVMNHLYHHRGEIIALLRVNGKSVPGLYGPTYEEQEQLSKQ